MTRLSVPFSSTIAMPTETWNSDSRSSRPSGSSLRRRVGKRQETRPERIQPFADVAETRHHRGIISSACDV